MFSERRTPSWQRSLIAVVGITAAAFVQGSGHLRFGNAGVSPDLVLCGVLAWAYVYGPGAGAALGFIGGLSLDAVSVGPVGLHSLILAVAGLVLGAAHLGEYSEDLVWIVLASLGGSVFFYATTMLSSHLHGSPVQVMAAMPHVLLPALAMDMLIVVFLVAVLRRREGRQPGRYQV